jgi:hypothetical protein
MLLEGRIHRGTFKVNRTALAKTSDNLTELAVRDIARHFCNCLSVQELSRLFNIQVYDPLNPDSLYKRDISVEQHNELLESKCILFCGKYKEEVDVDSLSVEQFGDELVKTHGEESAREKVSFTLTCLIQKLHTKDESGYLKLNQLDMKKVLFLQKVEYYLLTKYESRK